MQFKLFKSKGEELPTKLESESVKACWWNLFQELLHSLTDYDRSAEENKRAVKLAAEITDSAIEEYETRWGMRGK